MKYIVLSGSSGGMGGATVKKLTENGYFVFGLDYKEPAYQIDNFRYIEVDLTDIKSVEDAYDVIKDTTTEIDAIINMAGICTANSLIEMSEEQFINIFNINVFGTYRLNKVFTPLLKEKGKILIVSSELAPLDPLPFIGIYGITKSTIEKYAYSLRMELQLLNKQVVVIRPGAIGTSLLDVSKSSIDNFTKETKLYSYNAQNFKNITESVESKCIPPEKIGKLVNKILSKKKPKYTYKINRNFGLLLLNSLPQRFQNWIIKKILLKKK